MAKPTILVVDDDAACRTFLTDLLRLEGFGVIATATAGDALRFLRQGECLPDLCIVDFVMPDLDGFQFLSQLKNIRWTASIPILLLTGSHLAVEQEALRAGVAYFHKTGSNLELVDQVRRLLPLRC